MSAAAADTAEKGSAYLELLKQAAEAQMRRPAPPLPAPKKHKQSKPHKHDSAAAADSGDASDGEEGGGDAAAAAAASERVGRYSYAAADAVLAGCSGFIGMCDFKRSNSATKELLDMLKAVLPGGVKLQLVKVGCRGLVVITLLQQQQQGQAIEEQQHQGQADEQQQQAEEGASQQQPKEPPQQQQQQQQEQLEVAVQPAAVVAEVLARLEAGSMQRPRFCQRIAPVETTCAMAASALEAAVKTVVSSYLAAHCSSSGIASGDAQQQQQQQQQQGPVQFAVLFKNRDSTTPAGKAKQQQQGAASQSAAQQQQQQQVDAAERLDKSRAINIAVAAVHECCKDCGGAKVNLSQPQVVVMLEVLPLVGHQACAVSALPGSLMVTRPKLCVKPTAHAAGPGK